MKKLLTLILLCCVLTTNATTFKNIGQSVVVIYYYAKGIPHIVRLAGESTIIVSNIQRKPAPYFQNCAFIQYNKKADEYILESPNPPPAL